MSDEMLWRMLDERHEQVMAMLRALDAKLSAQNGRVGHLEARAAVLEDRAPGRTGTVAGSVAGGLVAALTALAQAFFGGTR
jgi:ferric-dicitrate binding protein FerR (iron transport regulator)